MFDSISWSIHKLEFTNDSVNSIDSGAYILSIAKHVTQKNVIAESESNVVSLRKALCHFIIQNSIKMTDFCIICGLEDDNQIDESDLIDWSECEICKRWVHDSCMKTVIFTKQFACLVCKETQ